MKMMFLAVVAATLSLNAVPVLALDHASPAVAPAADPQTPVERKSGRCPGGEIRFFVPGCSGV